MKLSALKTNLKYCKNILALKGKNLKRTLTKSEKKIILNATFKSEITFNFQSNSNQILLTWRFYKKIRIFSDLLSNCARACSPIFKPYNTCIRDCGILSWCRDILFPNFSSLLLVRCGVTIVNITSRLADRMSNNILVGIHSRKWPCSCDRFRTTMYNVNI